MKITLRDALTIPNILSYIRLLMIPFFTVLYMKGQYLNAGILAVLSGMSDVIDGWIARKFNQVTDLGKVLDPFADKLTQGVVVICLTNRFPLMLLLVAIWVVKEGYMTFAMFYFYRKYEVRLDGAKWYGKLSTWVLDSTMMALLLFPAITLPVANIFIVLCAFFMLFSLHLYAKEYQGMIQNKK